MRRACVSCLLLVLVPAMAWAGSTTPLADASGRGDVKLVRTLIQRGADVNARTVDGASPLHQAVSADHLDVADLLLKAGANVAAADRYGVTPLSLAALNGNASMIRRLLDAGADPNAVDPAGETALMTAARTGIPAALRVLLDAGAKLDARDTQFQQTALMFAVRENQPAAVAVLLERGAAVNAQTRKGPAPKFVPPCKGTGCGSEGVGINRGGLPDRGRRAEAKGGMTPLLYAARDGRIEAARLLVAAGADIELGDANAIRPLLMAVLNNHLDVARLLIEYGAEVDADDFWGRSPLWAAVEYRNLDMNNKDQDNPTDNGVDRGPILDFTKELLDAGANVNVRTREVPPSRRWLYALGDVSWVDFTGMTPFLRAALSGDTTSMRLLLRYGADPNLATPAGTTPLMAAAGVNWVVQQTYTESPQAVLDAVKMCLELGADINAANSMGLTALLGAANRGSNDVIEFLAAHGARLDVKDREGRTALRWAEGVFLAAVGAERKPATIALLEKLQAQVAPAPQPPSGSANSGGAADVQNNPACSPNPLPAGASANNQPHVYAGPDKISTPTRIVYVRPEYPQAARSAKAQGVVVLEAQIERDGRVCSARVVRSIPLLDQSAIDAALRWRFTPAKVNGVAVPVVTTLTVNFTLQ